MSQADQPVRIPISEFAERFQSEVVPLSNTFAYFAAAVSLSEEDLQEYLQEPVAALPPAVVSSAPPTLVFLVPYLERPNGKSNGRGEIAVCLEKPAESRRAMYARLGREGRAVLVFAIKDVDVADYHYHFYRAIAETLADRWESETRSGGHSAAASRGTAAPAPLAAASRAWGDFASLLREELSARVHGEVDEESWRRKQALLRRQTKLRRDSKAFRAYAQQAFVDTLTLYLHGICCDIDVDTGPRQLPSRHLRRRLLLLESLFPPPEGYAVFPEELRPPE